MIKMIFSSCSLKLFARSKEPPEPKDLRDRQNLRKRQNLRNRQNHSHIIYLTQMRCACALLPAFSARARLPPKERESVLSVLQPSSASLLL